MNRKRAQKYISLNLSKGKGGILGRVIRRDKGKWIDLPQTSDFSDIENSPAGVDEIQKLVSQAGIAAASEARALGIPKVFARGNEIIKEYADGCIMIITPAEGDHDKEFFRRLKPEVLYARKK